MCVISYCGKLEMVIRGTLLPAIFMQFVNIRTIKSITEIISKFSRANSKQKHFWV